MQRILSFIARISFCTYLVHFIVVSYVYASTTYDIYFTIIDVFALYLGVLVLSLFFGFIVTMTVELPFSNLLKLGMQSLLKNKRKEESKTSKKDSLLTVNESLTEEKKMKEDN